MGQVVVEVQLGWAPEATEQEHLLEAERPAEEVGKSLGVQEG